MANQPHSDSAKPSVSDLLRLKRLEKPADSFWPAFDRRLQRNLVQTVVCRPSWRQWLAALVLRPGLGLSAAVASFAVVFLLISHHSPEVSSQATLAAENTLYESLVDETETETEMFLLQLAAVEDRSFAIEVLSSSGQTASTPVLRLAGAEVARSANTRTGDLLTLAMTMDSGTSRTIHY